MLQENEAIQLLLGVGAMIFILVNRRRLRGRRGSGFLQGAVALLLAGWTCTILEGYFWPTGLNLVEHVCYLGASALILLWVLASRSRARSR
jgi:hypothetical protein